MWAPTAALVPHGSGPRAVGALQVIEHGRRTSRGGLPPRNSDRNSATPLHQKSSKNSVFPRPSESAAAFDNFYKKPIFADTYLPAFSSITIWADGSRDRPCEFRLRICPKPGGICCKWGPCFCPALAGERCPSCDNSRRIEAAGLDWQTEYEKAIQARTAILL